MHAYGIFGASAGTLPGGTDGFVEERREYVEPELDDEGSIVARAQDGDLAAFEHLVLAYQDRLFRLAYRLLNDRGEAEDVVQEALTASWRGLPMLRDVQAFGGWVYRLATNRCLDLLRKRSAHPETPTDPDGLRAATNSWSTAEQAGTDPVYEAERTTRDERLAAVLHTLPPEQRACWLLREMHGRSYAEIGATLKMDPTVVRGRLARARHQIAERMSEWR
ncbi:RNA polymerase sigma factor [Paeniglutamicibacter kerguelensis]|nr:sigma-70 family RNA polymerase sigma factor [Paeniglutamicibacter kerguelensis]